MPYSGAPAVKRTIGLLYRLERPVTELELNLEE
jgi:hypothetical protein